MLALLLFTLVVQTPCELDMDDIDKILVGASAEEAVPLGASGHDGVLLSSNGQAMPEFLADDVVEEEQQPTPEPTHKKASPAGWEKRIAEIWRKACRQVCEFMGKEQGCVEENWADLRTIASSWLQDNFGPHIQRVQQEVKTLRESRDPLELGALQGFTAVLSAALIHYAWVIFKKLLSVICCCKRGRQQDAGSADRHANDAIVIQRAHELAQASAAAAAAAESLAEYTRGSEMPGRRSRACTPPPTSRRVCTQPLSSASRTLPKPSITSSVWQKLGGPGGA